MFELAWWLRYVGADVIPIMSVASRKSRARQLVGKWNYTEFRPPTRPHTEHVMTFYSGIRRRPSVIS